MAKRITTVMVAALLTLAVRVPVDAQDCNSTCDPFANMSASSGGDLSSFSYSFDSTVPDGLRNAFNAAQTSWANYFGSVGSLVSAGEQQSGGVAISVVDRANIGGYDGAYFPPGSAGGGSSGAILFAQDAVQNYSSAELYVLSEHESGHSYGFDDFQGECAGTSIMDTNIEVTDITGDDYCWLNYVYAAMYNPDGKYQYAPVPLSPDGGHPPKKTLPKRAAGGVK